MFLGLSLFMQARNQGYVGARKKYLTARASLLNKNGNDWFNLRAKQYRVMPAIPSILRRRAPRLVPLLVSVNRTN
jgi:hypothetical protein